MANETFNPSGADREDFAALFNGGIDAKIAAEVAARDAADQTIIRAVGEIQAELEVLDISAQFAAIDARLTALEARVTALEGGGEDA